MLHRNRCRILRRSCARRHVRKSYRIRSRIADAHRSDRRQYISHFAIHACRQFRILRNDRLPKHHVGILGRTNCICHEPSWEAIIFRLDFLNRLLFRGELGTVAWNASNCWNVHRRRSISFRIQYARISLNLSFSSSGESA